MFSIFNKKYTPLFLNAWARLIVVYFISFGLSFLAGVFFIKVLEISPEKIFQFSTKRVSYVFPILETGVELGMDRGIMLFLWNTIGSLITIGFLYSAPLFDPEKISQFPQFLRKAFCGRNKMKILCYLPGCQRIDAEPLRRLYVWLMIPWLGMILLGLESGLTVSTSTYLFGSYLIGFASIVPHGMIEIPTIAFAGAVTFTAHLLVKVKISRSITTRIFKDLDNYIAAVPLTRIILLVVLSLLLAGLVEAHVTFRVIEILTTG